MKPVNALRLLNLPARLLRVGLLVQIVFAFQPLRAQNAPPAKYPNYPSETPATFTPVGDSWDYARREVMIPMRDGVKLHTVILVPKGAKGAPILLTRTPYNADEITTHAQSSHLGPSLTG